MMLRQRPETGLLAGLWEFPCTVVQSDWSKEKMWTKLIDHLCLSGKHRKLFAGEVIVTTPLSSPYWALLPSPLPLLPLLPQPLTPSFPSSPISSPTSTIAITCGT